MTPLADAANKLPLFILLTIKEALLPIPPEIERAAGVVALPIKTDELKSDAKIIFPFPFGCNVKLSSEIVPIVALDPAPRFKVVADSPRVADVVKVVSPEAVRVVSLEPKNTEFDPASRIMSPVVDPPRVKD